MKVYYFKDGKLLTVKPKAPYIELIEKSWYTKLMNKLNKGLKKLYIGE